MAIAMVVVSILSTSSFEFASGMVTNAESCTTNVAGQTCCDANRTKHLWTASGQVNFSDYETCSGSCCGAVYVHQFSQGDLVEVYAPHARRCTGTGYLPLIPGEELCDPTFRTILYLLALIYCLFGVTIIADKFMVAIEVITSEETSVTVLDETGKEKTYKVLVWNATIANLSLMALGSSAPE